MDLLYHILAFVNRFLWNGPMLVLLLGTHLFFTIRLNCVQKKLPYAVSLLRSSEKSGLLRALFTSLAATLGTGNIVGVSTAVWLGGPGAVFWCWLTGLFGMATAYAESYLCVKYRCCDSTRCNGGVMYLLSERLGKLQLGRLFAFFLLLSAFGVGCSTQAKTASDTLTELFGLSPYLSGLLLVLLIGYVILHGSEMISGVCSFLVPIMAVLYLICCIILAVKTIRYLPAALLLIIRSAFVPGAALGGILGGSVTAAARYGVARGLFTNEAGLGTGPLAYLHEKKNSPEGAALLSMSSVFFDTVVLCALTGLIVVSSLLQFPTLLQKATPTTLVHAAFSLLPGGRFLLGISLLLFAGATLVGWSSFGEQAVCYLYGEASVSAYRLCYLAMIFLGCILSLPLIWELTDFLSACMIWPNLYALYLLRREIKLPGD